jgi:hypothetical protein
MTPKADKRIPSKGIRGSRRVEVFQSREIRPGFVHGWWRTVKFTSLKKGNIFRLWDKTEDGGEEPDQKVRGQHAVNVALEDAVPSPELGRVQCDLVRGFTRSK